MSTIDGRQASGSMSAGPRLRPMPALEVGHYSPSALHADSCVWVEKNCYIDVWIELVHSLGLEPKAMLPVVVAIDFEGDQWTFFKPSHDSLHALYGIDVQELTVWRPLLEHAAEHLGAGKLISTEADAFWLPDTQGTDYRRSHTKTTVILADLDIAQQRLGYFHNAAYHCLEGEDFRQLFRVGQAHDPSFLPLFAELVRIDRVVVRQPADLIQRSRELLRSAFERRPASDPVQRFQLRVERDMPLLLQNDLGHYHQWAFATIRQLGAAFELASMHLRWAWPTGSDDATRAAVEFEAIAQGSKKLILKLARSVNSKRPADVASMFDEISDSWRKGMAALEAALQAPR